jgi:hypothetical protein
MVEAEAGNIYYFLGRMHEADRHWNSAARRAEQQHLNDAAGSFYALQSVHDALVSNCTGAKESAHHGLALDRSIATVPDAALAMALCGDGPAALKEVEHLRDESPTNTLVTDIYLPEIKAAIALSEHHPEQVAGLVSSAQPYVLVSKAPHLSGAASLATHSFQQAATDFEPGTRYKGLALQEGAGGGFQAPDYGMCLLGAARAQAQFDKATALNSYKKLLDTWKNAEADFAPAREAKREFAELQATAQQ